MAAEKLSPRQQMIGLMYLVLLAMLAMNASKDLLNAFIHLEKGIGVTNENLATGNLTVYQKIKNAEALGSEKAKIAYRQATSISSASQDISNLIAQYKKDLIEMGGGVDEETGIPIGKDNQDVGAEYLMLNKKGEMLRTQLAKYKTQLLSVIDEKDVAIIQSIEDLLATPEYEDYEGNRTTWEAGISEHMPLVAVTANLTNIETYVQNAETQVLSYLFEGIGVDTYKVNKIMATAIADKSYVLQGEKYQANVFLAASDTTQEPLILVGEYDKELFSSSGEVKWLGPVDTLNVKDGRGQLSRPADQVGEQHWEGIVKVPHPNPKKKGEYLVYPFEEKYTVAAPTAVISSEQLNIMYMGLNNEINISAPGIASSKLEVAAANCSVTQSGNGKYIIKPRRTGRTNIQVYRVEGEERKLISNQQWMVKRLPKPQLTYMSRDYQGAWNRSIFSAGTVHQFKPKYSDDFPLNGKIKIKSADLLLKYDGNLITKKLNRNAELTEDILQVIRRMRPGDFVEATLRVEGEDGLSYTIGGTVRIR